MSIRAPAPVLATSSLASVAVARGGGAGPKQTRVSSAAPLTCAHDFGDVSCAPAMRLSVRGEPLECKADRAADALTARDPEIASARLPPVLDCGPRAATIPANAPEVPAPTATWLNQGNCGSGAPLDSATRAAFEPRLGRSLGDVRVHTDAAAARDARALNARAFTHDRDIFFRDGAYQPQTPSGRWLLAHEIAHTQQAAPGVVSCFVADAPVPDAPPMPASQAGELNDAESESADAAGEQIANALEIDPNDRSGQGSRRLAKLSPARRRQAISVVRAKEGRSMDAGIARASAGPRVPAESPLPSEDRAPDERRERPPGSREEQTRRSALLAAPPPVPRPPAGAVQPAFTPAQITPRSPPSLTRETPPPEAPRQLLTSPSGPLPDPTTVAHEEAVGAREGDLSAAGGAKAADQSRADESGREAKEGAVAGEGDGPLRLSDLLEPLETPPEDVRPSPFVSARPRVREFATPEAGGPVSFAESKERAAATGFATPLETVALSATGGVPESLAPGSIGPTRRLALPLGPAKDEAEERSFTEEEQPDPMVTAAQMEGFAVQLETALASAREALQSKADETRNTARHQAASVRGAMRAEVDRATRAIRAGANSLLNDLASGVSAAHASVETALTARRAEVSINGSTSQLTISGIFTGHRSTVNRTVNKAVDDAEKLRSDKVNSTKRRNQADIRTAYQRGAAKMNSYPNNSRGNFIGGAAYDIAEGTASEMRKQEPDIVAGINEVTAPLPQHFREQGAQALDGFDANLPEILASVTSGITQTQGELGNRALEVHAQLDRFAADAEAEITDLADEAIKQAEDFLRPAEQQLDRALGQMLRTIAAAPKEVAERTTPPVEEAIQLFRTTDDPDVEAATELSDVLARFLEESVSSTNAAQDRAAEAGKQRFQAMRDGTRRAMRQTQTRTEDTWRGSRSGISTTLTRVVESADTAFGGVVKAFGDTLRETEQSIRDQLSPAIGDLEGSFHTALRDAERDIDSRIHDGMAKNTEALGSLGAKMQEAADEAAWEWDHPVLSALSFIAGILVGIITVLALVVALIVIVIVLAKVLAVSALVAGLILLAGMVAFSIGYAFGARLAAGQGIGEALGGAIIDFGRAVPGMLYEMTGIPKLKRAFSDERMTPYQRGKLIGEGGTELVLAIFAVRGAAKGIATGFRKLPKIPWRRPVRVPSTTPRPPAPAPPATPPRAPATTAPKPPGVTSARPPAGGAPPVEAVGAPRTEGLRALPGGRQPPSTPRPSPELQVIEGGGGRPARITPEPAPTARRPDLRAIEGGGQPSPTPRQPPKLRAIEGGRGRTPSGPPEPTPPRAQPQRAAKAAGAEGHEPVFGETLQPQRPGLTVHEGGVVRPGGRAPLEPRASAEPPGFGGPRPRRPAAGGEGGRPSVAERGVRPQRPSAPRGGRSGRPVREAPAERPSTGEPSARQAAEGQGVPEVKAEPAKPGAREGAATKERPGGAKPKKPTPQQKAQQRLSELQQQKTNKEAELKALRKQRDSLREQHNKAVEEQRAALREWDKAGTAGERQAARQEALAAKQRAESVRKAMDELPGEESLLKDLKALESDIGIESIKANPQSRGALPCFSAETTVLTPHGPCAIADLQTGDAIWTYDFSTGTRHVRPILQLHRGRTQAFYCVQLAQGAVRATSQHRFWVETDAAWRTADSLAPGMWLRDLDGNKVEVVDAKREPDSEAVTFNLSVEEFQTYFVGPGVLVHNEAVDVGLGGDFVIYRATNPNHPSKVYIGQTTELDVQGKPRGVEARQLEHQELARNKLRLDAEGIEKLSPRDRAYYEFMKDAKLEPQVKGISSQAQADFLEQHNIDIERRVSGEHNVVNRRNQITSESHLKEVVEKIKADPAVKAKGYCP